ncbi:CD3324 family protein [Listeria aquatica]|uniref:Response regulator transcription factor n=1 Tax=Listeria aquatica TaxID=1494960 RepID=A0A841ZS54_9LIST|nr:CD3324 family protein [Listeria aquatica]MBC1521441.1 response regulator transcription factor [Listeria aquatica]
MKYQSVEDVLPESLIEEIQKYASGTTLYIPARKKRAWGANSGIRSKLKKRNEAIKLAFEEGTTMKELAENYFLSENTIRNIIYQKTC